MTTVVARPEESLTDLLERIRACAGPEVWIDLRAHGLLREGGHARRLLRAAAADLGKHIAFTSELSVITQNPNRAAQLTTPSVAAITRAARRPPPPPRSAVWSTPRIHLRAPWSLLTLFTLLAAATAAAAVTLLFPRATVRLTINTEPLVADLDMAFVPDATSADPASARYPARQVVLEETIVEEVAVENVTETGERAQGKVDLVNETDDTHAIRAGTRLQSAEGITLRTRSGATLPPRGRVSVSAQAESGGTVANLSSQRLTLPALSTAAQRVLYAEVRETLRGGSDRPVKQVSRGDVDRGISALKTRALSLLEQRAAANLGRGTILAHEGLRRVRLHGVAAVPAVGREADRVRVSATVQAEILAVDRQGMELFLRDLLDLRANTIAPGAESGGVRRRLLDAPNLDDLRVVGVNWTKARADLSLRVETRTMPELEATGIAQLIAGHPLPEAEQRLRSLGAVGELQVSLVPPILGKLPKDARKIRIVIEPP